ncbi:MAG: T9SS type A sorting domain-containing protein [Flavobacteriales bacterium]
MQMICKLHRLSVGRTEQLGFRWKPQLYPNPGSDLLSIKPGTSGMIWVRILDITGRQVLATLDCYGPMELSTSQLRPGIYLVEVHGIHGRKTLKWTKQ